MIGQIYSVIETDACFEDYARIELHIENWTGDRIAARRIVDQIRDKVLSLSTVPHRGTVRPDLGRDIRIIPAGQKAVIACAIDDEIQQVIILRVFYGGEDYESLLVGL